MKTTKKTIRARRSFTTLACLTLLLTPAAFAESPDSSLAAEAVAADVATGVLTGRWQLNKMQSDDPSKVMGERRGGSGGGPGGPGRGSGDSGGPDGPGADNRPTKLEIVHHAGEIIVSDGGGRERDYFTDGREATVEGPRGEVTESARWAGEALVVTSRGPRGDSTETYRLNADGQLEITHERAASGDRPALRLRTVYDPVENR